MKSNKEEPKLSSDAPKRDQKDDALGFSNFAKRLSKTIVNISSEDGFVIGLCGQWGSGKTTALNFTKAYLTEYNQKLDESQSPVIIIDFEPWLFSGRSDLISAYFKVLAESLQHNESTFKKLGKITQQHLNSLAELVAAVAIPADPTVGIISGAAINVGKQSLDLLMSKWLATPSLQETYKKLTKRLASEKQPILVVIDDLDRLSPEEIRTMMQMVKSVGKLPYVTYLLAYDKSHVSTALEQWQKVGPLEPTFAEKIIQHELTLPQPAPTALLSLIDKNIEFLIPQSSKSNRVNQILTHGVRQWIRTPRDINRYTNALKFAWAALENEIDPEDVLAMEGLRLFEPRVFDWIKGNSDFFFFNYSTEELEDRLEDLRKLIKECSKESTLTVITFLFPQRSALVTKRISMFTESVPQVVRRDGIGCARVFQIYMSLSLEGAISAKIIHTVVDSWDNEKELYNIFEHFLAQPKGFYQFPISVLFTEIEGQMTGGFGAIKPTQALVNALFSIGEKVSLIEEQGRLLKKTLSKQLYDLIIFILYGIADSNKIEEDTLTTALASQKNTAYGVEFFCKYCNLTYESSPSKGYVDWPVSKSDWISFKKEMEILFNQDLESKKYLNYPSTWCTILVYNYFHGKDRCKSWIIESAKASPEFFLGVVSALSIDIDKTQFRMHPRPNEKIYDLEQLLSIAKSEVKKLSIESQHLEMLKVFIKGVTRHFKENQRP